MKLRLFLIFCISLFLEQTIACSPNVSAKRELAFRRIASVKEMNTKIKFWDIDPKQTYKNGDSFELDLENFSPEKIIFPNDFGIRIFTFNEENGKWMEIVNGVTYLPPTGNRQVSPKGPGVPGVIGIILWPILENEGKPVDIRVVVIGNVEKDDVLTDEQVGAYIDLTLQP